jgi:hypothetical protein
MFAGVAMRGVYLSVAFLGLATVMTVGPTTPTGAVCSVFDKRPCAPTVCSVYQRRPCIPQFDPPIGQDLRLTIESPPAVGVAAAAQGQSDADDEHKLNTLSAMFEALRGCWVPPPAAESRPGMQMSVRLSFKRNGEIIGEPRVTYTTPGTPPEVRDAYHHAITAALERCTPLPFTTGLGGAIAGRPIAIRFVDNREQP